MKTSVSGLVYSAQTAVRFVRERSAYPPGQRNVDYGCFDGQRNLEHTTERHQRGFKVPMETGSMLPQCLAALTSAVFVAEVWKPPDVPQSDAEAHHRQHELGVIGPGLALSILGLLGCRRHLLRIGHGSAIRGGRIADRRLLHGVLFREIRIHRSGYILRA